MLGNFMRYMLKAKGPTPASRTITSYFSKAKVPLENPPTSQQAKAQGNAGNSFSLSAKVYNKITKDIQNNQYSSFNSTRDPSMEMGNFEKILRNNKAWAKAVQQQSPGFFQGLSILQQPQYLWIGCSDSRVPANEICGLKPGQIFVHRNVANQAPPSDINFLAVIQFSVQVLKVKDIIVTGHYGCGGIRAAFQMHDHGPLQAWLSHIRELRWKYRSELNSENQLRNEDLLVQLNVKQQVYNITRIPVVQQAWKKGQELRIHGLVYNLKDGLLNDLGLTLSKIEDVPPQFRIFP